MHFYNQKKMFANICVQKRNISKNIFTLDQNKFCKDPEKNIHVENNRKSLLISIVLVTGNQLKKCNIFL